MGQDWIDVSQMPPMEPNEDGTVMSGLVWARDVKGWMSLAKVFIGPHTGDAIWFGGDSQFDYRAVTHWMPPPAQPVS